MHSSARPSRRRARENQSKRTRWMRCVRSDGRLPAAPPALAKAPDPVGTPPATVAAVLATSQRAAEEVVGAPEGFSVTHTQRLPSQPPRFRQGPPVGWCDVPCSRPQASVCQSEVTSSAPVAQVESLPEGCWWCQQQPSTAWARIVSTVRWQTGPCIIDWLDAPPIPWTETSWSSYPEYRASQTPVSVKRSGVRAICVCRAPRSADRSSPKGSASAALRIPLSGGRVSGTFAWRCPQRRRGGP